MTKEKDEIINVKIKKRKKPIKKTIKKASKKAEKLENIFVYESKEAKYKKYKWVVIFSRHPSGIRGKVPALYMREKFKGRHDTVWGPIDKSKVIDGKRIDVIRLPQTHIDFLLNEIKYVKEF